MEDMFDLIPHIETSEDAVQFLRNRGVLRSVAPMCPQVGCQREMTEIKTGKRRHSGGDDTIWRCPTHKNRKQSIRKGSFLENSNLAPRKFVLFTYFWAHGVSSACQESMCGMSRHSAVDWNMFLRDICSRQLLANPVLLGGPGRIVQIDESLMAKRKYHVGHQVPERWIFGMYDLEEKLGVLEFVEDRTQATLFPLIRKYVRGGTMIHSGTSAEFLPSYLDEFQWRQLYGKKTVEAFDNILQQISHFYPVNQ